MARKRKGVMGAMGNLIRWTIWGLAGLFIVALYLNWTKTPQLPGADEIAVLPPPDTAVPGASDEEPVENATQEAQAPTEVAEEDDTKAEADPGEDEAAIAGADQVTAGVDAIRIPGDNAVYTLLNAFRRDDGSIEITTERVSENERNTTIRLVRCAPLQAGVIAEGDGPRNDAPEMIRIPLGNAVATLAATACGAMK